MSRPSSPPSYCRTVKKGRAYARAKLGGVWVSLGVYGSAESHQRFAELQAQWRALQEQGARPAASGLTVANLVADFFERHALEHYRHPDGSPTSEIVEYRQSVAPLLRLYGTTPARDFGPLDLKAVRLALVTGSWLTPDERANRERRRCGSTCCRSIANRRTGRIARIWKWAASEELVTSAVYQALATVDGLAAGRGNVRESAPIPPVPDADVDETLPALPDPFRTMTLLQLATGMRPGEVCAMRRDEIDRQGLAVAGRRIWVYRPDDHKTRHHGITKAVALGPAAQLVLTPILDGAGPWLFPGAGESGHVTVSGYAHAVLRAARKVGVPDWCPSRLRKTAATAIEEALTLDSARAVLGHSGTAVTKAFYAKADLTIAAKAAAKMG